MRITVDVGASFNESLVAFIQPRKLKKADVFRAAVTFYILLRGYADAGWEVTLTKPGEETKSLILPSVTRG